MCVDVCLRVCAVHAYVRTCACMRTRTYGCTFKRACQRVHVCVPVCACMPVRACGYRYCLSVHVCPVRA